LLLPCCLIKDLLVLLNKEELEEVFENHPFLDVRPEQVLDADRRSVDLVRLGCLDQGAYAGRGEDHLKIGALASLEL
jgi:hypothetical protein